jgi:tricorn protease
MKNKSSLENSYLLEPAIKKNQIYFVSDDDIWRCSIEGGNSVRLTQNQGMCGAPLPSPSGDWLAFQSNWKGSDDLYLMSSMGGEAQRLTFKTSVKALKWINETTLIISSNHESSFRTAFAYKLDINTLNLDKMNLGYLTHYDFDEKGNEILVRNGGDPARWKRYRGGTAGQIWSKSGPKAQFKRILSEIPSNLTDAHLYNERVYFLSDHEGIGNLFSCEIDGSDIVEHTQHNEYYCRGLKHDSGQFIYASGAELFVYDLKKEKSIKLDIRVRSSFTQAQSSVKEASHYPDFASVNSDGSQLLSVSRGHLFSAHTFGGSGLHHSNSDEKRYGISQFIENGKSFLSVETHVFSDRIVTGRVDETHVKEIAKKTDWGKIWSLRVGPYDAETAITNNRGQLFILNNKTQKVSPIFKAPVGRAFDASWSPCGRFLAFSCGLNDRVEAIHIYDGKTKKVQKLIDPVLNDYCPSFDPTGNYLYFCSVREFFPTYGETHFSTSFPKASGIYAVALNKLSKNPFENWHLLNKKDKVEKENKNKKNIKPEPVQTKLDLDGIENRIFKAPIDLGGHWRVIATKNGFVYGQSGPRMYDPDQNVDWGIKADIYNFSLEDKKSTLLQKKVDFIQVTKNLEKILIRSGEKFRLISATSAPGETKGVEHKDGWIDLNRFRFKVEPKKEWKQIYDEAWLLQKEHFWDKNLSKVEWAKVYKRYLPLLNRVKTRRELSDLLWEMQGELGTSHCYEFGGDYQRRSEKQLLGLLGAEFQFDKKLNSMRVTKVYSGDSWNLLLRSPLLDSGVNLEVGDRISDIDGVSFSSVEEFYSLLTNKNKLSCSLLVQRKTAKSKERVEVKTLSSEKPLIYRDWVKKNTDYVHKATQNKVGYVHVPNMMVKGFSEFYRGYLKEGTYDALIVDVRFNGGGHVSQHLLTQLSQKVNAFVATRYQGVHTNPNYAIRGPIVAITNEFAGSDGDIFSHNFKQMKIGPLIGVRTWGGVVGINGQYTLKDGTQTTQPEYSYYFRDVGFKVENYGTDPDIEVVQTPEGLAKGKDEQLDRAIEEILKLLDENPAVTPEFNDFPNLSLP